MPNAVSETTSPTATATRKRRGRPANGTRGIRSGAGAGMAAATGTAGQSSIALTPEQRTFYELGARHACELHGVPWQGGLGARR